MNVASQTNDEQAMLWNGVAGRAWVELQVLLDHVFKPHEDLLIEAIAAKSAGRILDIGCGTGATTLAAARWAGSKGRCLGIDISDPMIEVARARAEREGMVAEFVRADVQTHSFEPASVDMIISRFGVMFFDDPVEAFANLRRAAADDAELRFLAWRSPAENPFMTAAERAATPLLPNLPARQLDAPGQFAFADPHRIEYVLANSGWTEIDIRRVDVACRFPANDLIRWFTQLGPLGRAFRETDERTRIQIIELVRAAYDPYVHGNEVRFNTACWLVGARSSD